MDIPKTGLKKFSQCMKRCSTSYVIGQTQMKITRYHSTPTAAAASKSLQSCPTLCDPIDGSPPGFPSLRFSRQEHWSGLPFPSPMHESEKWKWSRSVLATPWTAAYQAPLPMGFSRQEYWSGLPLPSPMGYYSAIKKNEILPFATTWMDIEGITLSEISQIYVAYNL